MEKEEGVCIREHTHVCFSIVMVLEYSERRHILDYGGHFHNGVEIFFFLRQVCCNIHTFLHDLDADF